MTEQARRIFKAMRGIGRPMRCSVRYSYVYGFFYRRWSILIHRYGYHHTRTLYPADEKGVHPRLKCDWCGFSGPKPKTVEEMIAAMRSDPPWVTFDHKGSGVTSTPVPKIHPGGGSS